MTYYVVRMGKPRTPTGRCRRTHEELKITFPHADCELEFNNPFQLLVATILSAQATDKSVNKVTPQVFRNFPNPEKLAEAKIPEIENPFSIKLKKKLNDIQYDRSLDFGDWKLKIT